MSERLESSIRELNEWKARAETAERALVECAREAGADTSGGVPTWPPLTEWALKAVKELRADYDEAILEPGEK